MNLQRTLLLFLVALAGGVASVALYETISSDEPQIVERVIEGPPVQYTNYPTPASSTLDFTLAAEKTVNAVVHVRTETEVEMSYNPWFDFFGYDSDTQVQQGSGSGVIISRNGYIVTNNHVIDGASKITVSLNDNKSYEADLIGADPSTDIALLKISEKNLPTVSFGNSDNVKIGEWVLAVGNPFDLTSTVTAGIVSAKARNINLLRPDLSRDIFPIESFIQTDAAVNPGNSGGALVNTNGELVGINTAIASRTGSYAGYSFAVPSSIVEKVTRDLMEFGQVQRAYIGVRIQEMSQQLADEIGYDNLYGVYVNDLIANGAAADAGIRPGDVIQKVGNREVRTVPELQEQVSRYRPGEDVLVTLWRDGSMNEIYMTLRNKDGDTDLEENSTASTQMALGAEFASISQTERSRLNIDGGAKVKGLGSGVLRESGVKENFIITKVDGEKVKSPQDLSNILNRKSGGVLIEGIYPNGSKAYYGFGI